MSDGTEDVKSKRRMSDSSSSASSADEDSSSMAKPADKKELDNSGFRVDGEPLNKPRKVRHPNHLYFFPFFNLFCTSSASQK